MTDLSPAAQAVLDAFKEQVELTWLTKNPEQVGLAAALRAAADQVVPIIDDPEFFSGNCCERVLKQEREETRAELLAIAAELEAQ